MINNTNTKIDAIRETYSKEKYEVIQSIGLIALLTSYFVYPYALVKDGNYTSAVYLIEDDLFRDLVLKWDEGEFDELKLFNKSFAKVKKSFSTGLISDMKAY